MSRVWDAVSTATRVLLLAFGGVVALLVLAFGVWLALHLGAEAVVAAAQMQVLVAVLVVLAALAAPVALYVVHDRSGARR